MTRALIIALLAAAAGIFMVITFSGSDPDRVPTSSEVTGRIMSPFCPGLTLDECPTGQSARMRAQIESMIREGKTNEEIDNWVVENYGESALAAPAGAVAWLGPAVVAVAGLVLTILFVGRVSNRTGEQATAEQGEDPQRSDLDPAGAALVDEDFSHFQRGNE